MANKIRKIINRIGLDVHKYRREPNKLAWLKHENIKTVFDVGANVGQFATEIRQLLPNAQIYSFEPLKDCFEKLKQEFAGDQRFRAFNMALGEKRGAMTMNKSSYTPSSSLRTMAESHKGLFPHTKENVPVAIEVERLDDMYAELNPQPEVLIKVDTQGYEDQVISGGMHAFKQAKIVLIEACFVELYVGQPLFDDIYGKMRSLGYVYRGALHQKLNSKTGEVIFEDAIFVRK